jgi:hypothetical protein
VGSQQSCQPRSRPGPRTPGDTSSAGPADRPGNIQAKQRRPPHRPGRTKQSGRKPELHLSGRSIWHLFVKPVALGAIGLAVCALGTVALHWLPRSWRFPRQGWLPFRESWPLALANFVVDDLALIEGTSLMLLVGLFGSLISGSADPDDDARIFVLAYAHAVIVYAATMTAAVFSAGLIFTCSQVILLSNYFRSGTKPSSVQQQSFSAIEE